MEAGEFKYLAKAPKEFEKGGIKDWYKGRWMYVLGNVEVVRVATNEPMPEFEEWPNDLY